MVIIDNVPVYGSGPALAHHLLHSVCFFALTAVLTSTTAYWATDWAVAVTAAQSALAIPVAVFVDEWG